MSNWIKERDNRTEIVWRNRREPTVTVEAYDLEEQSREPDDLGSWYVFGAINRKGVRNSPHMVTGKGEAIRVVAEIKKAYENMGLAGLSE